MVSPENGAGHNDLFVIADRLGEQDPRAGRVLRAFVEWGVNGGIFPEDLVLLNPGEEVDLQPRVFQNEKITYTFGSQEIDHDGTRVNLSSSEDKILQALIKSNGGVTANFKLVETLDSARYPDYTPSPQTIKVHISNLRKKLKEAGAEDLIETVRGAGYRLRI